MPSSRKRPLLRLLAEALLGVAVLAAGGPALAQGRRGPPSGGGPPEGGPPPPAYDACSGRSVDDGCAFQTPDGLLQGVCADFNGSMACLPAGAPRPPSAARRAAPEYSPGQQQPSYTPQPPYAPQPMPSNPQPPMNAIPQPVQAPAAVPVPAPAPAPAAAAGPSPATSAALGTQALAGIVGVLAAALAFTAWRLHAASKPPPPSAVLTAPPWTPAPPPLAPPPALSVPPPSPRPSTQAGTEAEGAPATPPPSEQPTLLRSGATVKGTEAALLAGNYEVRGEIGRGGMGVVYEALDRALERRVALKKMRPEINNSRRDRDRFLAEAKAVARLQHPNIVSIYSIVEDANDLYLVFEFVDGESLDQMLDRQARLSPAQVLPILARVADAIDYAHDQKVIHRDLKPSNIMLDKSGKPKVMDFGIAHQAKLTVSRVTNTIAAGTMAYMPPEQMLGQAVRESDVYAFAALTYEALTGGLPFPGPDFNAQKVQVAFKPPSQAAEGLKASLDGVFLKALQPEPKRRYTTSREFVAALQTALA